MIKSIHIQNFRCFEDFKLQGFGHVNLIGGMNNAGKTALLEGIAVGGSPAPKELYELKGLRYGVDKSWKKESKNDFWNDIFFNNNLKEKITFKSYFDDGYFQQSEYMYYQESIFDKGELEAIFYVKEAKCAKIRLVLGENNSLELSTIKMYDEVLAKNTPIREFFMIPTTVYENTKQSIIKSFSQLELDGKADYLLDGLKCIDTSIVDVKIVATNEPNLYMKREGQGLMPINFFGDAITKLTTLVLAIVKAKDETLLIDEIENGIHYTNQPKVWETIFKLAKEFNVQIFATTHSKEMATAFAAAAKKLDKKEEAKYIEMARHYKTNQIVGLVHDIDLLEYKIEKNEPFRGE